MNTTDPAQTVIEIAEELRAVAAEGLHYSRDPHDRRRYEKLRNLAARAWAVADTRQLSELTRRFQDDVGIRTPAVAADAAVFDAAGRLLLTQRRDGGMWCMPGGAADVGETPSQAAERETWEETGLQVRAVDVVGVYDSRVLCEPAGAHAYQLVVAAEVVGGRLQATSEACDFGWFTCDQAAQLSLYRGHVAKVPDAFEWRESRTVKFH